MSVDFLNSLDLHPDELATLRGLGAGTPAKLLSVIRHPSARERLCGRFGEDRIQHLESKLQQLVPPDRTAEPMPAWKPFTGALDPKQHPAQADTLSAAPEREQLIRQIEQLRQGPQTPETRQRAAELEQQLVALLKFA